MTLTTNYGRLGNPSCQCCAVATHCCQNGEADTVNLTFSGFNDTNNPLQPNLSGCDGCNGSFTCTRPASGIYCYWGGPPVLITGVTPYGATGSLELWVTPRVTLSFWSDYVIISAGWDPVDSAYLSDPIPANQFDCSNFSAVCKCVTPGYVCRPCDSAPPPYGTCSATANVSSM